MIEMICKNYYILAILIVMCGWVNCGFVVMFMDVANRADSKRAWGAGRYMALAFMTLACVAEWSLAKPMIKGGMYFAQRATWYSVLQYANIAATIAMMLVLSISYLFDRLSWGRGMTKYCKIFSTAMIVSAASIIALMTLSFWVD